MLELAAYTDAAGATVLWRAFGEYSWSEVPEDWQHRWREFHRAVRVGPLWVGPPVAGRPPADAIAVVIDPGRAFGTGAHPTTQLCLELLLDLAPRGGSVVDVGCGSGVLAIAAREARLRAGDRPRPRPGRVEAAARTRAANDVTVDCGSASALERALCRRPTSPWRTSPRPRSRRCAERLEAPRSPDLRLPRHRRVRKRRGYRHVERRELDGWARRPRGAAR